MNTATQIIDHATRVIESLSLEAARLGHPGTAAFLRKTAANITWCGPRLDGDAVGKDLEGWKVQPPPKSEADRAERILCADFVRSQLSG